MKTTASEVDRELYAQMVKKWAAVRWLWVDDAVMDELAEAQVERVSPIDLIDAEAEAHGLEDPYESWGVLDRAEARAELTAARERIERVWKAL